MNNKSYCVGLRQNGECFKSLKKSVYQSSLQINITHFHSNGTEISTLACAEAMPFDSFSMFVLSHVGCNGWWDLSGFLILSKIFKKLAIRSHQVHYDSVIDLQFQENTIFACCFQAYEAKENQFLVSGYYTSQITLFSAPKTHNVVIVFIFWALAVIHSVCSGHLLNLGSCSCQTDKLGGKLCMWEKYKWWWNHFTA